MSEVMLVAILCIAAFHLAIEAITWGCQKLAKYFCTHLWMNTGQCARCGSGKSESKL